MTSNEAQIEERGRDRYRNTAENSRSPANKLKTIPKGSILAPAVYKLSAVNKERLARLREEAAMSDTPQLSRSLASATLTSGSDTSSSTAQSQGLSSLTANSQLESQDMGSAACETVRSFADQFEPPSPKTDSQTPPKKSSGKKKQSKKHNK